MLDDDGETVLSRDAETDGVTVALGVTAASVADTDADGVTGVEPDCDIDRVCVTDTDAVLDAEPVCKNDGDDETDTVVVADIDAERDVDTDELGHADKVTDVVLESVVVADALGQPDDVGEIELVTEGVDEIVDVPDTEVDTEFDAVVLAVPELETVEELRVDGEMAAVSVTAPDATIEADTVALGVVSCERVIVAAPEGDGVCDNDAEPVTQAVVTGDIDADAEGDSVDDTLDDDDVDREFVPVAETLTSGVAVDVEHIVIVTDVVRVFVTVAQPLPVTVGDIEAVFDTDLEIVPVIDGVDDVLPVWLTVTAAVGVDVAVSEDVPDTQ